jgi:hypothetical protein
VVSWLRQLPGRGQKICHCCDFAAAQWSPSTEAIASMVSVGGCHTQLLVAFTLDPSLFSSAV